MKILVLNCGSSSVKYQLINIEDETALAVGCVERIGLEGSFLEHEVPGSKETTIEEEISDHKEAIKLVVDTLVDEEVGVVSNMEEISAVGHRVAHGGEKFTESVIIDDQVLEAIEETKELAPLHNPPNLLGIEVSQELMPDTPNTAVFDTAFHQSMPPEAYIYPLPYELYEEHGIRRYGFHGTSHKYVASRAADKLGQPLNELKVITCHLGNGASIAAIDEGKSVDTSMGLTPLEGLVMGTRSGDIDPGIIPFIMRKEDLTYNEVDELLNRDSGVAGVSGISNDFRDLEEAAEEGHERAQLAIDIFCRRVRKYIASYGAVMGGIDVIVFTAGIGENSPVVREKVINNGLDQFLDIKLDEELNLVRGKEQKISSSDSDVLVLVVPTNEELVIARETKELVSKKNN